MNPPTFDVSMTDDRNPYDFMDEAIMLWHGRWDGHKGSVVCVMTLGVLDSPEAECAYKTLLLADHLPSDVDRAIAWIVTKRMDGKIGPKWCDHAIENIEMLAASKIGPGSRLRRHNQYDAHLL